MMHEAVVQKLVVCDQASSMPAQDILFKDLATSEIQERHIKSTVIPAKHILKLKHVEIHGLGVIISEGQVVGKTDIYPHYFKNFFNKVEEYPDGGDPFRNFWLDCSKMNKLEPIEVENPLIFATHPNMIYGHFLMEMLPKLLILSASLPKSIPVAISKASPAWAAAIIQSVIPDRPIFAYDHRTQFVRARTVYVCENLYDGDHQLHPFVRTLIAEMKLNIMAGAQREPDRKGRKVFLSRSKHKSGWHGTSNEDQIEEVVSSLGLEIIHPEKLSFPDQVRIFNDCSLIAGEFGSAMHNSMFAPPGCSVVCLNWINWYQSRITNLWQQRVGYLPTTLGYNDYKAQKNGYQMLTFDIQLVGERIALELRARG